MANKVKVAVTGAAGAIGYSILPRIASGQMFGPDTNVELRLLELPPAMGALQAVAMEMEDCAFPLLDNVVVTDDTETVFDGVNWALLIGAKPRTKGMERSDLIKDNGPIFVGQGKAIEAKAAGDVRVVVVGNPCNTNALIAMQNAKSLPRERFTALTFLDQNRSVAQLAIKAGVRTNSISHIAIWGNHSTTMYPDLDNARIEGKPLREVITDADWLQGDFIKIIQQRGAAIINARGASSAASAANATIDHVSSFLRRTEGDNWFSAGVPSDGSYGIDEGLIFSFPVRSDGNGGYSIVQGLTLSDYAREKLGKTLQELRDEKAVVADLLG